MSAAAIAAALAEIKLGAALRARAHAARFIEDKEQRYVRQIKSRRRAHVDRKNPLQSGSIVAAGAITLRAADDQQTAAQFAHVLLNVLHLCIRQLKSRHIIEHQEIKRRKLGESHGVFSGAD